MTPPLIFVVAPAIHLPQHTAGLEELQTAQSAGPTSGFALRIFSRGADHADLSRLPLDGTLTGAQRRSPDGTQLLCDAVVVRIEPQHHWLGVYQADPDDPTQHRCLDRVALSELSNATCWFYPTHDGTYLSWSRDLRLSLQTGCIADCPEALQAAPYDRRQVSVLWSLLGDDQNLTCVGLTYGGQRFDWPLNASTPEPTATWRRFRVDNQADPSLAVEDGLTVSAGTSPEA